VVACRHPCFLVALSVSVDDVAGIAVLGLPTRIKDPLPDRHSALVGWSPRRATRMDGCLLALGTAVVSCTTLLAYAGCRAFGLLHDRLLDESLHLTVQVLRLGRGHGPKQHHRCDELLTCTRWRVWIVDIEVGVDALAGLLA
jgi:hypothetical protein